MKNENYTTIKEFEVIKPTNDMEFIGEKLKLSMFGEYCPDNSLRFYNLSYLLKYPNNYRPTVVIMKGEIFNLTTPNK